MINSFTKVAEGYAAMNNLKLTENGAIARISTGDNLVDLFGTIGALRERGEREIEEKFASAFAEDALLATKMAFYARNPRGGGGLGERRVGRICLNWLAKNKPDIFIKNIPLLSELGRWDDFYSYLTMDGTNVVSEALWHFMSAQLCQDLDNMVANKPISLLAKWLKSPRASSKETRVMASITAKNFGLTSVEYRKMLSSMRRYLNVTEVMISDGKLSEIEYSAVPSYAMKIYKKLFKTKDGVRFSQYLTDVANGKSKINASVLYPYDLVDEYLNKFYNYNETIEAQWKSLPDYVGDGANMLVMADVSGSMHGRPMATSIGLAIYFAQHNHGAFKNLYMTFTDNPSFIQIPDKSNPTLYELVNAARWNGVGFNTDLEKAFDTILRLCVHNHIPQSDLPEALVVISDMEIDGWRYQNMDFVTQMAVKFANCGYKMPKLVMWNVQARQDTFHAKTNDNVQFISGSSPSAFADLIRGRELSAYELMVEALSNPIYDKVII